MAEHTKCDGVPCTKSQQAQQHSSMSSYIGGVVLQQLAPTKTDVEDDEVPLPCPVNISVIITMALMRCRCRCCCLPALACGVHSVRIGPL